VVGACLARIIHTPPAVTVAARASRGVRPVLARHVRQVRSSLRFRACAPICLAPLGLARRRVNNPGSAPFIVSLFDCHRTPPCAARTSGLDASANLAGAPRISLHPRAS